MQNNEAELHTDSRIDLKQELQLISLTGGLIAVRAQRLSLTWSHDKPVFWLIFEVDPLIYQQIYQQEWFGLYPQVRGFGSEVIFDEATPIEIRVILRQSLSVILIARGEDVDNVLNYLLQDETILEMPIKHTESWLAAEIKQQVELPDELADGGTLKKGYRTAWMDQVVSRLEVSDKRTLNEIIEQFLDENEWGYERLDDSLLRLAVQGEQGDWVTLVQTDEEDQRCIVYSVYPDLVPESRREAVAAILTQENYEMPVGNFEMDLTDGEVRFRTSIEVVQNKMTSEWFERMFMVNISITDGYFTLINGEINLEHQG
jgi:hypothetical protein